MLKDKPCLIIEIHASKSGKHGQGKFTIKGKDVFTGNIYTDVFPTRHVIKVPFIEKTKYEVVDMDGDMLALFNVETNDMVELPFAAANDMKDVDVQIREALDEGLEVRVGTLKALGEEKLISLESI